MAAILIDWIEAGQRPGSNAAVRVEVTDTGRAIALARMTESGFTMRNGGENAIVDWLVDTLQGTTLSTIVLYENGRVPRIVAGQAIDADIDVITTRAFLDLAERRGLIASSVAAWALIEAEASAANPHRRTAWRRETCMTGDCFREYQILV